MNENDSTTEEYTGSDVPKAAKAAANAISKSEDFKARIYRAISVQRPVVLEYLRSLRREKPEASPGEILAELEKRYVATVTTTSAAVGVAAAIPAVGVPVALGLGVVDLLFFYETSALYVLAATELHGIEVHDVERARPLVFGMLLGQKSQSKIAQLVFAAAGVGSADAARDAAKNVLPKGWGEVLTEQLPDSAIAPIATVIAREALKNSAKYGAGTLGKVLPFGVGAIVGGVGSFTFGRDVVKSARLAFPEAVNEFPAVLHDFSKADTSLLASSRAAMALQAAASNVSGFGHAVWDRSAGARGVAKQAGGAIKGGAVGVVDSVNARFKPKGDRDE